MELIWNPSRSSNIVTVLASTLSLCLLLWLWLAVPERRCFYCSILKMEAGAFPSCLAVDVFFLADWLEGSMVLWPILVCQYAIYLQMSIYCIYKWVFKGAWPWPNRFVSLYTDCTSCSDFRNKLDNYVHYLSMDVSEPGWFNWDRDFYCFENVYL